MTTDFSLEPTAVSTISVSHSLRVAGRAALVAGLVWIVLIVAFVLTLINPDNMRMDQTLAEFQAANPYGVPSGAALIVMGVAVAILVLATSRVRQAAEAATYPTLVAHWFGLVAAATLVMAGTIDLTGNGLAGIPLTTIPDASDGARWLAHQSFTIVHEAMRLTACVGLGAWMFVLALTGQRVGLVGRALKFTLIICAVLIVVPGALTGLLTGMNFVMIGLLPLAVGLLRRAKSAT